MEKNDLFEETVTSSSDNQQNETSKQELSLVDGQKDRSSGFETKFNFNPGFLSRHRVNTQQLTSPNNNVASGVIADLSDYSSTTDLIPLSMTALKNEKSRRLLWLDNASLMVHFLAIMDFVQFKF